MKANKFFSVFPNHWLLLLFLVDLFFIFVFWLIGARYFPILILVIIVFTLLVVFFGGWYEYRKLNRQQQALESFFKDQDEATKERLQSISGEYWKPVVENLAEQFNQQDQSIRQKSLDLLNYQEYIEGWAHEIKTPLSLMTLVLANHQNDMSDYVFQRMEHIRHAISSDVDQILYYARLQANHVDYKFGQVDLREVVLEVLNGFKAIEEERKLSFKTNFQSLEVVSDRKVLVFIVSQLLSNAVKYARFDEGLVCVSLWEETGEDGKIHLAVRDNGEGVPEEDLPFLFDKGFTGSHPGRQEATGMGLFLAQKYCQALSIDIFIEENSSRGEGFGIQLVFLKTVSGA